MENQPMTGGRRWFRLGSVAQLNAAVQGPTPAPAQGSGQSPSTPAPTQGPAPSSAPLAQVTAPRIPFSGLPSERAPAPPQPQPPLPPQTQQTQASNIVNGTQASQQPTPPSPNPRTPAQSQPQPPPSPRPRTPSQPPPPPSPRSTIMARPLTPQPPESPKPRTRTWPPTPTSESPRTRIPSPPPESPKVIKTLTPPQLQPIRAPPPYPEPEPKPEPRTNHITAFMQQGSSNGSVKTIADINGKQQGNSNQSHIIDARSPPPPPSPARRETMINGEKKFITMAGENMGAYMELGSPGGQHINRKQNHGYFLQHQNKSIESEKESTNKNKKKDGEKMPVTEGKPMVSLVNSNVQSVNNSIIFRSSCTQQSPGVHETILSRHQPKHKGTTHQ